jgi:hypothetical protein
VTQEMSIPRWILVRWVPCMVLAAAAGAVAGVFRAGVGFVVGIQGMLVMGILGYVVGRLGRGDPDRHWLFPQRIWLSLTVAVVFGVVHVLVLSLLRAGPYDGPVEWLGEVVGGRVSEAGAGVGATGHVLHGYSLNLTGPAWVLFTLLDLLLGAFLFLATCIAGLSPSAGGDEVEEPDDAACPACGRRRLEGARFCEGCGRELPAPVAAPAPAPAAEPTRGSRAAGLLLVAVLAFVGAAVAGVAAWHQRTTASDVLSLDNLHRNQRLVGRWEIAAGDGLAAIPAEQRRFAVKLLGMDDIAAISEVENAFLISLRPVGRRGETFEGRLEPGESFAWFKLPASFGLPVRLEVQAQVAADASSMRLVVERKTGDKRAFTARRVAER